MDVLLQRRRVTVVEVHPRRLRRELVDELAARGHDFEDAVHVGRVDAVEVDRVRMRARIDEADAQDVVLGRPDHRARDGAVVRPRGEEDTRRDLDLLVECPQLVLTHPSRLVRQRRGREEEAVQVGRSADGGRTAADHRRVPHRRVAVHVGVQRALRRLRVAVERHLGENGSGDDRSGTGEEAPTSKFRHD